MGGFLLPTSQIPISKVLPAILPMLHRHVSVLVLLPTASFELLSWWGVSRRVVPEGYVPPHDSVIPTLLSQTLF